MVLPLTLYIIKKPGTIQIKEDIIIISSGPDRLTLYHREARDDTDKGGRYIIRS